MEVQFAPELQLKIDRWAVETGRAPDKFIKDAVSTYIGELEETQEVVNLVKNRQDDQDSDGQKTISEIIRDGTAIDEALDKAFYRAVKLHREANVPMSFTDENHKPYEMDAKDIEIPEKYADLAPFRY
jgi:predicted DNA-binding protein